MNKVKVLFKSGKIYEYPGISRNDGVIQDFYHFQKENGGSVEIAKNEVASIEYIVDKETNLRNQWKKCALRSFDVFLDFLESKDVRMMKSYYTRRQFLDQMGTFVFHGSRSIGATSLIPSIHRHYVNKTDEVGVTVCIVLNKTSKDYVLSLLSPLDNIEVFALPELKNKGYFGKKYNGLVIFDSPLLNSEYVSGSEREEVGDFLDYILARVAVVV